MKNSDMPAFPEHAPQPNGLTGEEYGLCYGKSGLTKREYFAIKMMQAQRIAYEQASADILAKDAIKDADELLKQLAS